MENLIRLFIPNERILKNKNNNIELSNNEAHYLNNVMRIKVDKEIFITNGQGSLWKAIKVDKNNLEISQLDKPYYFKEKEILLLGLAVVVPKNGFEDILKMCTEIGIDIIQPLFAERQNKKNLNFSKKFLRWNLIINEAVEQSERLWKPSILNVMDITNWINSIGVRDQISISVTRENNSEELNKWLEKQKEFVFKKKDVIWNVVGPEGGWSKTEIQFFIENKIPFIKLSESILRTSTASVYSSSILTQWRNDLNLSN